MNNVDEKAKQLDQHIVERVQTGARMEKRMVKVLKGLAEYLDISLGDLLEGLVLHGMDYGVEASHRLQEIASKQEEGH